MSDINQLKAQVRSILLSCGKTATEVEFRKAFYEIEGVSFIEVLRKYRMTSLQLFSMMPDVVKIIPRGNLIFLQRVSTDSTSHMDDLTINKYSKSYKGPKLVTKSGQIKNFAAGPHRKLSVQALPYNYSHNRYAYPPPLMGSHYVRPQPINICPPPPRYPVYQTINTITRPYQPPPQKNANINVTVNCNNNERSLKFFETDSTPQKSAPPTTSAQVNLKRPILVSKDNSGNTLQNIQNIANKITVKKPLTEDTSKTRAINSIKKILAATKPVVKESVLNTSITSYRTAIENFTSSSDDDSSEKSTLIVSNNPKPITLGIATKVMPNASSTSKSSRVPTNLSVIPPSEQIKPLKKDPPCLPISNIQTKPKALIQKTDAVKNSEEKENVNKLTLTKPKVETSSIIKNRLKSIRNAFGGLKLNESTSSQTDEVPSDLTNILVTIPAPKLSEENLFFEIKIMDVLDPSKFTFQFSLPILKELSINMNSFYSKLKDVEKYRVKELTVNNFVAIRNDFYWYRGQIKSFNQTTAFVQNVDCLKIAPTQIPHKYIYHLHHQFSSVSPKSVFGRLYGLKPIEDAWNISSVSKLIDIQDKSVLATVKNVENEVYSLSICLDGGRRIAEELVKDGLAEYDYNELQTKSISRSLV